MNCQHAGKIVETKDCKIVVCKLLSEASGFKRACSEKFCQHCMESGANDQGISHPGLNQVFVGGLRARLLSGDCPRYQTPNPIDLSDVFATYREAAGDDAARALLPMMLRRQGAIAEDQGGHPPNVVARKLLDLAKANDMEDAL